MRKTAIATALLLASGAASAATGEFCMFDGTGAPVNGGWATTCDETVTATLAPGLQPTNEIASTQAFFGQFWDAHDITVYDTPGTYTKDTGNGIYTFTVGPGQVGGHMLFDWGVVLDIDVVNVWDVDETGTRTYTSTDWDGDGILGGAMIDGAFVGFSANFNLVGNDLPVAPDLTPPVITLLGDDPQTIVVGDPYTELDATCIDPYPIGGTTTLSIDSSTVNTSVTGSYTVTYTCIDANSNPATPATRTVNVVDPDAVTTLLGSTPVVHECESSGFSYVDDGAQCSDPTDGTWTSNDPNPPGTSLVLTGVPFDSSTPGGPFNLTWTCTDSDSNTGTAVRVVNVEDNTPPDPGPYTIQAPVGTIAGSVMTLETNDETAYADMNPTLESVTDSCDTTVPSLVMTSDVVDFNLVGSNNVVTSTLNYTTADADSNLMDAPLTVNVNRSEPVITLLPLTAPNLTLNIGDTYIEYGMNIFDAQDGSIEDVTTSGVVTPTTAGTDPASPRDLTVAIDSSAVDTSTQGDYQVTYDVTDFDGNPAAQVIRTVSVGVFAVGSNFTMLDSNGEVFGGTNDVVFDWDQTFNTDESDTDFSKMKIFSQAPWPFFGFVWTAHNIRVFDQPGTYSFDTTCSAAELDAGITVCDNPLQPGQTEQFITMTVDPGQIGAHILFDWNTTKDIDVVNVWEVNGVWDQHDDTDPKNQLWSGAAGLAPDPTTTWKLVSTDVNGDGVNSSPMVDGPFQGFYANFNAGPGGTAPPLEPYTGTAPDTKLGGGLFASPMNPWVLIAVFTTLFGARRFSKKSL